jgi:hypothetical protein
VVYTSGPQKEGAKVEFFLVILEVQTEENPGFTFYAEPN